MISRTLLQVISTSTKSTSDINVLLKSPEGHYRRLTIRVLRVFKNVLMCVVIKKRTFPVLDNLAKLADLLIQLKDNEDQANIELYDEILSTTSRLESETQKTKLAKFYNQT